MKAPYTERYVRCCERTGVSRPLLLDRSGDTTLILEEYYEELHIKNEKQISYEDGFQDGIEQGMERGKEERQALADENLRLKAENERLKALAGV